MHMLLLAYTEVTDQVAGIRHMQTMGLAHRTRVGIYGWSYGGYATHHFLNVLLRRCSVCSNLCVLLHSSHGCTPLTAAQIHECDGFSEAT
jgi:hypothetical protein